MPIKIGCRHDVAGRLRLLLANKVAVVTGGASGIGAAIVDAYAVKGATVVVLDKDVDSAQRKVSQGSAVAAYGCDVTSEQSVAAAISAVSAQFGRIDVLVNSAGLAALSPAEELTVDTWDLTMAVNLRGAFLVSQQVGRIMLAQGSGTVISLASQAATIALPGHLAYCASKSGLVGLTKVLALEWAGRGVTANTISPTVVLTPARQGILGQPGGRGTESPDSYAAVCSARGDRGRCCLPGQRCSEDDQRCGPAGRRRLHHSLMR